MAPTPGILKICRARFVALDDTGAVLGSSNNVYVTDAITELTWSPEVSEGDTIEQRNGCGDVCLVYRNKDKVTRYNLGLTICRFEPALISMLTGGGLLSRTSTPVGFQLPGPDDDQPNVAAEFWAWAWDGDARMASPNQYLRLAFPGGEYQLGDHTHNTDPTNPNMTGKTRSNPAWGTGPFSTADTTALDAGDWGALYLDSFIPASTAGEFDDLVAA